MEYWRIFSFMYLSLLQSFCGQESIFRETRCNIEYQSGCVSRVATTFEDRVLEEKKEFNIIYKYQTKEETVAVCEWLESGQFSCDPANGFKCDNHLSKTFACDIDTTNCLNSGEFLFDIENMDTIQCKIQPSESNIGKMAAIISNPKSEHQNIGQGNIGKMAASITNPESEHKNIDQMVYTLVVCFCGTCFILYFFIMLKIFGGNMDVYRFYYFRYRLYDPKKCPKC